MTELEYTDDQVATINEMMDDYRRATARAEATAKFIFDRGKKARLTQERFVARGPLGRVALPRQRVCPNCAMRGIWVQTIPHDNVINPDNCGVGPHVHRYCWYCPFSWMES